MKNLSQLVHEFELDLDQNEQKTMKDKKSLKYDRSGECSPECGDIV